jgi:hypothetical protein
MKPWEGSVPPIIKTEAGKPFTNSFTKTAAFVPKFVPKVPVKKEKEKDTQAQQDAPKDKVKSNGPIPVNKGKFQFERRKDSENGPRDREESGKMINGRGRWVMPIS